MLFVCSCAFQACRLCILMHEGDPSKPVHHSDARIFPLVILHAIIFFHCARPLAGDEEPMTRVGESTRPIRLKYAATCLHILIHT